MQQTFSDLLQFFREAAETDVSKEKREENLVSMLRLWFRGIATNLLEKIPEEKRETLMNAASAMQEKNAEEMEQYLAQTGELFSSSGISPKDIENAVLEEGEKIRAALAGS